MPWQVVSVVERSSLFACCHTRRLSIRGITAPQDRWHCPFVLALRAEKVARQATHSSQFHSFHRSLQQFARFPTVWSAGKKSKLLENENKPLNKTKQKNRTRPSTETYLNTGTMPNCGKTGCMGQTHKCGGCGKVYCGTARGCGNPKYKGNGCYAGCKASKVK